MPSGWRDSRFGQFSDPNFGMSLYRQQSSTPTAPVGTGGPAPLPDDDASMAGFTKWPGAGPDGGGRKPNKWDGSIALGGSWYEEGGPVGEDDEEADYERTMAANKFAQSDANPMLPEPDESKPQSQDDFERDPSKGARENVNKIMDALSFGRGKYGLPTTFFGGTQGVSFAEGGAVEDEGMIPDGSQGPQRPMAYLTGQDAAPAEFVQQLESRFPPQMSPSERKYRAVESAPSPDAAWGVMQHYRKRYNAYSAFAQAAATGNEQVGKPPNMAAAAKAATQAFENIPDGNEVMFRPVEGGMEVMYRPIIPTIPAPNGGEKPPPQALAGNIPTIPAPNGGEKPPVEQELAGNIPTIPAPNGGEKPPPEDIFAAGGGVIPDEDDDVTGTVTFDPKWAPEDQMPPEGRAIKAGVQAVQGAMGGDPVARADGITDAIGRGIGNAVQGVGNMAENTKREFMTIAQFLGFMRDQGQVDSVMDKGLGTSLEEALRAGAVGSADPMFAHGQDPVGGQAPAAPQQAPQAAPQGRPNQFPDAETGWGPGGQQLVDQQRADWNSRFDRQMPNGGVPQGGGGQGDIEARASRLFPWVSQGQEREAFLERYRQGRQGHSDKMELTKAQADALANRVQLQVAGRQSVAETNSRSREEIAEGNRGQRREQEQGRNTRQQADLEARDRRQGNWIEHRRGEGQANRDATRQNQEQNRAAANQRSVLANKPGELPDDQLKRMAAGAPQQQAAPAAPQGGQQQPTRAMPMPRSKDEAVAGQIYQTARGPMRWTGTGFVAP